MSYYTQEELNGLGFEFIGDNVLVSKKASIYGHARISIGHNSRIDDFVVISAGSSGVKIGRNVHIAVFSSLIGDERIILDDFSGISSRVSIYSSNDDYSGRYLTNPTVPSQFTGVKSKQVYIGKHVIVGSGTIILPGAKLYEGVSILALSLVMGRCIEWSIYSGTPAKKLKDRKRDLLTLEYEYINEEKAK